MDFTLADLEKAKFRLACANEHYCNDMSGNPRKHQAEREGAKAFVKTIEDDLKKRGLLPYTEWEILEMRLNSQFPKARSKQIVELGGKTYQKRFSPIFSRSGKTIVGWDSWWETYP